MTRFLALTCGVALAVTTAVSAALETKTNPTLPGVADAMQHVVDAKEAAGLVVLVADKDHVLHVGATGMADIAAGRAMTTDTLFRLASSTKLFSDVAILMLQDEGKLKLTDPIEKYIPEFGTLRTPSGQPAHLTLEQMLTHTTGIADAPRGANANAHTLADIIAAYFPAPPMLTEPGTTFRYVGGYTAIGRVIEIVSGKTYDEFIVERILQPLGMNDTTFYPTAEQAARLASSYTTDRKTHELTPRPPAPVPQRGVTPPNPGGGLISNARDLGRFCQMLLNRGQLDGQRYLSDAAFQSLITIRTGDIPTGFSTGEYNKVLGWGAGAYVVRSRRPGGVSEYLSPGSFGHPGAQGIHAAIDPVKGLVYVLLQQANPPDNYENRATRTLVATALTAIETGRPGKK